MLDSSIYHSQARCKYFRDVSGHRFALSGLTPPST